jgi:membrane fusion protein, heavy metal efflux system
MNPMNSKKMAVKFLLIALVFSHAMHAYSQTVTLSNAQIKKMQIVIKKVSASSTGYARTYSAEVMIPNNQLQIISAPQQGLINSLKVANGQEVKKGSLIAQLSSPELIGLQSEYLQAKTQLSLAASTANRDKLLTEDGIIPKRRYLESQSKQTELSALVMQKKQALRLAGMSDSAITSLNSATKMHSLINIYAPMSGQIITQVANVGDRVDIGMPIYQIAQLSPLWVVMNVPIEEASSLQNGLEVSIPKSQSSGKIVAILRNVNKATQTLQVRAEINQGTETLAIGQFVEAAISQPNSINTIQVPKSALMRNGNQTFVFKRINAGFESVPVTINSEDSQFATVKGQLIDKDLIAVSGLAALKGTMLGLGGE